jgi:hypothetical protein
MLSPRRRPPARYAPTYSRLPTRSEMMNAQRGSSEVAASGTATVLTPGMNFANMGDVLPLREMNSALRRTQVSGSRDILQRKRSAAGPPFFPMTYQTLLPMRHAVVPIRRAAAKCSCPLVDRTPAAIKMGIAGRGKPSCSAAVHRNRSRYPCLRQVNQTLVHCKHLSSP